MMQAFDVEAAKEECLRAHLAGRKAPHNDKQQHIRGSTLGGYYGGLLWGVGGGWGWG